MGSHSARTNSSTQASSSAHCGSVEKSQATMCPFDAQLSSVESLRPALPAGRRLCGGVAEHLVAVLEFKGRLEPRGVGVDLDRTLGQLHAQWSEFSNAGGYFDRTV